MSVNSKKLAILEFHNAETQTNRKVKAATAPRLTCKSSTTCIIEVAAPALLLQGGELVEQLAFCDLAGLHLLHQLGDLLCLGRHCGVRGV